MRRGTSTASVMASGAVVIAGDLGDVAAPTCTGRRRSPCAARATAPPCRTLPAPSVLAAVRSAGLHCRRDEGEVRPVWPTEGIAGSRQGGVARHGRTIQQFTTRRGVHGRHEATAAATLRGWRISLHFNEVMKRCESASVGRWSRPAPQVAPSQFSRSSFHRGLGGTTVHLLHEPGKRREVNATRAECCRRGRPRAPDARQSRR